MATVKTIAEGTNFSAINLGGFAGLSAYSYQHPKLNREVKGKVFLGELLKATGAEVSFQLLPPFTAIPFLHRHNRHEELYVFLQGAGQFQVDDAVFEVAEGTVIRIGPEGRRSYRNNSANPLIFMCIQCVAGSLVNFFVEDGSKAAGEVAWAGIDNK